MRSLDSGASSIRATTSVSSCSSVGTARAGGDVGAEALRSSSVGSEPRSNRYQTSSNVAVRARSVASYWR